MKKISTMDSSNQLCTKFANMNKRIKHRYPNAKFDLCITESSLNRIVSFQNYIIVAWIGDICCGSSEEGHKAPKCYTFYCKTPDYITLDDVIQTLIDNNFEVPCDFKCFEDVIPAVNPLNSTEPVYLYLLNMSHYDI